MRFKIIFLLILLVLAVCMQAAVEYYLEINPGAKPDIEKLSRLVSIHKIEGTKLFAYANERELAKLGEAGFSYIILPHPSEGFAAEMAATKSEMRDWDVYPTYDTYIDIMNQFAIDYPDICEVYSIGQSTEGRELMVAHIGDDLGEDDNEPEFYYMGQIHGNELVTSILLLHLIDDMLQAYGSDPRIDNIINEIDIYINPVDNPDGLYAGGNNTVNGATRSNANSVDLNRNFPCFEDGPHPDGNEYQVETLLQMEFAAEHNFVMGANLHSGAEVVNYPWDTWSTLHADDDWWQQVSHSYADAAQAVSPASYFNGFNDGITNGYQWYTTAGNHQDYMNWYEHCREVTLELSDVQMLPANQLLDHYIWNHESMLRYIEECLFGIRGVVTDDCGSPLAAVIRVLDHDMHHSEVLSDPHSGNYHRPIYAGTWDIEISAWGFESQVFQNISVGQDETVILDATLQIAALGELSGVVIDETSDLPVFGAWAVLADTPLEEVMTGSDGAFNLANIPIGEYELNVYASGYISAVYNVEITAGTNEIECILQPSEAISFESGDLPAQYDFSCSGNANWFVTDDDAHNGLFSVRSGDVDDREVTRLILVVDLVEAGNIDFWKKVSSEENYDFLNFYLDGSLENSWSGTSAWSNHSYDLTAGEHTFVWEYDKDTSVSNGSDCAWIDDILISGLPEVELVYGDVDDNGEVGAYDASLVQRYFVEMYPGAAAPLPWQYWRQLRADVDGNGSIEAYDASLILQYFVGMIDHFPVEELDKQ
ncbi:MAG: carboxypeptidase regulatory-like domain-containing protein [Candidatus Cloacimonetes bacterium]|nr:carboxypeptidase regulatory-like domain-containing protein [Candidatus Cloacimonadota bacterium]